MLLGGASIGVKLAIEAKRRYVDSLLQRRNVVACGVGYKESEGTITDEPCIVVGVSHKVPKAQLAEEDLVPQMVGDVRTDVQEVGIFRALGGERERHRPAFPGISCGHVDVSAGTIGCLVRKGGEVFLLSNNHVLANTNRASQGDAIIQPGRFDGGTPEDRIATLEAWVPLKIGTKESDCPWANAAVQILNAVASAAGSSSRLTALQERPAENQVDCAIARPLSADLVTPSILDIGIPKGVREGVLGMDVQKVGRTTGYTTGRITQVDVTVQVDYEGQAVTFVDQFMATGMSSGGDSGSAILDMEGYVVGLLFAGSQIATLINPIQLVTDALGIEIVTA
jgi:hypothetical protein